MANPGNDKSPGRKTGMSSGETARLVILGVVALVVLVVIAGTLFRTATRRTVEEPDPLGALDVEGGEKGTATVKHDGIEVGLEDGEKPGEKSGDVITDEVKPFKEKPGMFEGVEDRADLDNVDAYYYAVHKVAAAEQKKIVETSDSKLTYPDLIKYSGQKRGTFVRIRGSLLSLKKNLLPENVSGIRNAYLGQLVGSNQKVYTFLCLHIPDKVRLQDVIEVHALYYKLWKYEARSGRMQITPYFIARTFSKIPAVPPQKPITIFGVPLIIGGHTVTWWELSAVLILVIFAPALFFLVRYERRKFVEFKKEMIEKKKKKRPVLPGKRKGAAEGETPEGEAAPPQGGAAEPPPPPSEGAPPAGEAPGAGDASPPDPGSEAP
jgi:hypothetical protein